jgi:hypothetical protein
MASGETDGLSPSGAHEDLPSRALPKADLSLTNSTAFADLFDPFPMVRVSLELIGGDQMPRYFFHIRDGWEVIPDEEGMDLSNLRSAEVEGYASADDLASAALAAGRGTSAYAVEIADGAGTVLSRIEIEPVRRFAS